MTMTTLSDTSVTEQDPKNRIELIKSILDLTNEVCITTLGQEGQLAKFKEALQGLVIHDKKDAALVINCIKKFSTNASLDILEVIVKIRNLFTAGQNNQKASYIGSQLAETIQKSSDAVALILDNIESKDFASQAMRKRMRQLVESTRASESIIKEAVAGLNVSQLADTAARYETKAIETKAVQSLNVTDIETRAVNSETAKIEEAVFSRFNSTQVKEEILQKAVQDIEVKVFQEFNNETYIAAALSRARDAALATFNETQVKLDAWHNATERASEQALATFNETQVRLDAWHNATESVTEQALATFNETQVKLDAWHNATERASEQALATFNETQVKLDAWHNATERASEQALATFNETQVKLDAWHNATESVTEQALATFNETQVKLDAWHNATQKVKKQVLATFNGTKVKIETLHNATQKVKKEALATFNETQVKLDAWHNATERASEQALATFNETQVRLDAWHNATQKVKEQVLATFNETQVKLDAWHNATERASEQALATFNETQVRLDVWHNAIESVTKKALADCETEVESLQLAAQQATHASTNKVYNAVFSSALCENSQNNTYVEQVKHAVQNGPDNKSMQLLEIAEALLRHLPTDGAICTGDIFSWTHDKFAKKVNDNGVIGKDECVVIGDKNWSITEEGLKIDSSAAGCIKDDDHIVHFRLGAQALAILIKASEVVTLPQADVAETTVIGVDVADTTATPHAV